jgi:hypothetical protein
MMACQSHKGSVKNKATKIIEEEEESIGYLEVRNVLQGEGCLGRTLTNCEKETTSQVS